MAIVEMEERSSLTPGYEYAETIADGETGDDIHLVDLPHDEVACMLIAGANTGKFQFTLSSDSGVLAGTAVWADWPEGVKTGTSWDTLKKATGIRGVSVSGEIKIEVLI